MDYTGTQILKLYYLAIFLETCEPKKGKQPDVAEKNPANPSLWAVVLERKEMMSSGTAIFHSK